MTWLSLRIVLAGVEFAGTLSDFLRDDLKKKVGGRGSGTWVRVCCPLRRSLLGLACVRLLRSFTALLI